MFLETMYLDARHNKRRMCSGEKHREMEKLKCDKLRETTNQKRNIATILKHRK